MIWSFTPFATEKTQFGRVYNDHVSLAPFDDDWILIRDWDTMPLTTKAFQVIEKAIERYPDTSIFGAMTNRVAYEFQTVLRNVDDNPDIHWHINKAEELADKFSDGECQDVKTVAGFFLLFRKAYWNRVKFQDTIIKERLVNGLKTYSLFDEEFCRPARENKEPIRMIKGVYIFHLYRMNKDWRNKDHLKI